MSLTHKLKQIRKDKKLSQNAAAEKMGVPRSTYAYLENKADTLKIYQLFPVAKALGIDLAELIPGATRHSEHLELQNSERVPEPTHEEEIERMFKEIQVLEERINDKDKIINGLEYKIQIATSKILGALLVLWKPFTVRLIQQALNKDNADGTSLTQVGLLREFVQNNAVKCLLESGLITDDDRGLKGDWLNAFRKLEEDTHQQLTDSGGNV